MLIVAPLLFSCAAPSLVDEASDLRGREAWGHLSAFATSASHHLLMTLWCDCDAGLIDSLTSGELETVSLGDDASPMHVQLSAFRGYELYWAVVPSFYAEGESVAPEITAEYKGDADRITASFVEDLGGLGPGLLFEFENLEFVKIGDDAIDLGTLSWSARYSESFDGASVTNLQAD